MPKAQISVIVNAIRMVGFFRKDSRSARETEAGA